MKIKKMFEGYRGLPSSIYILFIAIIINRAGNFVLPFSAMLFTKNLGFSEDKAGLFVMLISGAAIPGILIGGVLVDRLGRKKVMVTFQFLAALCLIPCAFLENSMLIPYLLILSTFFLETAQPAYSALVTDLTSPENRKEAFSLLYLGINIGFSIGPMAAGFLFNNHMKWFFIGDAFTSLVAITLAAFFVKDTFVIAKKPKVDVQTCGNHKTASDNMVGMLLKSPFVLSFMLVYILYAFVYVQHTFSMPLFINEIFKENGPTVFGTVMTINAVVVVALSTIVTSVTRNNKPILNVTIAGLFYSVGFGMVYFVNSYFMLILSTVVWTLGEILASVNSNVYIADHSPETHRGRFNSFKFFALRAGFSSGPFVMGLFIKYNGTKMVWPVMFILAAGAAMLMYVIYTLEKRSSAQKESIYEQAV